MSKKKPELEQRVEELTADLQRAQADFMNFRRRAEEQRGMVLDLAKQDVVLQLLPLLDNVERALGHVPAELADNAWAKGVDQVAKQAQDTLKQLGVEKINSVGQPFDHNLHDAVATDESGEHEVVVEELQPGYKLGDKIIRHAMVKVGKK
ncbi:MAG TPA: nucleotide exchange factor GrpE [Candidatus Nanoarchaeia archaeon]|nr:nucleotide exchange factor GrpE [Candidatus Nanoarchaeia archaeon]